MILRDLLTAINDPDQPVVRVDRACPIAFWRELSEALKTAGFSILDLDQHGPADSHERLLWCFQKTARLPAECCPNLNALKDALLTLDDPPSLGWVVLFREAGLLRQNDATTFEDLSEVLSLVNDIKLKKKGLMFKLVVSG